MHQQKESCQQEPKAVCRVWTTIRGILKEFSVLWIIFVFIGVKYLLVKKLTIIPKSRVKMTKLKGDVAHEISGEILD